MTTRRGLEAPHLAWVLAALCGCDNGGAAATDASTDRGADTRDASAASGVESTLDDPTPLRSTEAAAPGFGDPEVMALTQRLPASRELGATPDAFGFFAEAAEALPAARAALDGRPRQLHVTVALMRPEGAAGDATIAATLASTAGAVMPRRVESVEAGDAFRPRAARPLTPEALRESSLDARLTPGDRDAFTAVVYFAPGASATLTLRVGDVTLPIASGEGSTAPETFELADGTMATVTVARDPGGPCVVTRALALARTMEGRAGAVGEFRGVLHRGATLVGYVRGVFGAAPSTGREALYLQATGPDGRPLWFGEAPSFAAGQRRAGRLTGAGGAGSFVARVAAAGPSALTPISLEFHTECR